MKLYIIIIASALWSLSVAGQSSVERILQSVEANNKELQASGQLASALKIEAKTENNLPDPSISYTHQYGNKEGMGIQGELVASQSFDFPSVYSQRNKLAKIKAEGYDYQRSDTRQRILLQAKETCLDLVMLNQRKSLLERRRHNAERLSDFYDKMLQAGAVTALETNKIELELLNVKTEERMNETARLAKLNELAILNGGIRVEFADTVYSDAVQPVSFEDLRAEVIEQEPSLRALRNEQSVVLRQVSVNKAKGLPGFELGYRLNTATGGERFNGFLVGISIPLFSNRNVVRQAKARSLYTNLQYESTLSVMINELRRLFDQSVAAKASADEYARLLDKQNNEALLNKAIQAGQISVIDYFVEITTLYQSYQNYIQLQNEYQKAIAGIYKHRL